MSDNFIRCPHCNKVVSTEHNICTHCGANITSSIKANRNSYNSQNGFLNTVFGKFFTIITIIVLWLCFGESITFHIKHFSPKYTTLNSKVDITEECKQEKITPTTISYKNNITECKLILQAKYSLSGMVVVTNTNFSLLGLKKSYFDELVPFDFGIIWGEYTDIEFIKKHCRFFSSKNINGGRRLTWSYRNLPPNIINKQSYLRSHISHNHIIPANDNIKAVLLKIKTYDKIRLEGYLTDIKFINGQTAVTSLSRQDFDDTARGGGACEIFYVTGIQIGNKYYK